MKTYSLSDFDTIPSIKQQVTDGLDMQGLPTIDQVRSLANWNPHLLALFDSPREEVTDRSAALGRIAYFGAELNWSDEQMMAALLDADDRWGKYRDRSDRMKRLVDFINRARSKYGYNPITEFTAGGLIPKASPSSAPVEDPVQIVYDYGEFLDSEFHVDWLLNGLFASGGLGLITGYPGVGKTQFCLQLAHHMALGYDRFLKWDNADGPKKVMFLSLEMGANPLHLFMKTIAPAYTDRETLKRNFHVVPLGQPVPLDTKEGQAFLNSLLDEYMPDILLIDSFQKILSSELSDEQAVKNLMHYLAATRAKYKTSMAIIHHNRKKSNDAQKKEVELSDVYGSTYITADVDFVLSLKTLNSSMISVDTLKNRLGPTTEQFDLYRDENLTFALDFDNIQERFGHHDNEDDEEGDPTLPRISSRMGV